MSIQQFREAVKNYRRSTAYTQKSLADALGLHQQVLSRKMSDISSTRLTHNEIKKIVQLLAEWKGIFTRDQAAELLGFVDLKPTIFSNEEWAASPLNQLETATVTPPPPAAPGPTNVADRPALATRFRFDNLPVPMTSLVGRETDIARVGQILSRPATRLLSLVGPGGCGKTRLAIEVGRVLAGNFSQGVCFVNLADVTDPAYVGFAIAQACGLLKSETLDPLHDLKTFLRDYQLLLILDNFEQVTKAASLVEELLNAAPGLKIMVTSRVTLHLYGEQEFAVPPLDVPEPAGPPDDFNYHKYEAIQLFVERARAVKPDFALTPENGWMVARLCQELNGLPLALELAATRIKLLPIQVLLERLTAHKLDLLSGSAHNLPGRQRTLRNTLDWSYNLLEPTDQRLFRALGIFRSSFSIEAAQAIGSEVFDGQFSDITLVLERLEVLLDASLIQQNQPNEVSYGFSLAGNELVTSARFKYLETIREYALEQLGRQGELARLQLAKAQYYLQLIRNLDKQLNGPEQVSWIGLMDSEYPNIRAAVEAMLSAIEKDGPAQQTELVLDGLELCRRITQYWDIRGHEKDGLSITQRFVGAARLAGLTGSLNYAWALSRAGAMTGRLGDLEQAQKIMEESLPLHRALGDDLGTANAVNFLASYAFNRGDYARAREFYLQSEEIVRRFPNKRYLGGLLISLADVERMLGNEDRAYDLYQESLAILQEQGNKWMVASCLFSLGVLAEQRQDYDNTLVYLNKCLEILRGQGDHRDIALVLHSLANVFYLQGHYPDAQSYLVESLRFSHRIDDKYQLGLSLALLAILNVTKFEVESAENGSGGQKHYLQSAARLMGSSQAQLKETQGVIMDRVYRTLYEEKMRIARSRLGEAEFSENYTRGLTSPLAGPADFPEIFADFPAPRFLGEGQAATRPEAEK